MKCKVYCLRCEAFDSGCKCGKVDKQFRYSHKLRVPSTKNKVKFRKFLDDCPQFVNCVSVEQRKDFRKLLIRMKYFDKKINGQYWTVINKRDKE